MIEILNWSKDFENANTRKRQRLGWYLSPTGCDSRGYRLLTRKGVDGVLSLGVFCSLCQAMATLSKDVRVAGIFAHSDGLAMSLLDLSELTRIDRETFEIAIPILAAIPWIKDHSGGKWQMTGTEVADDWQERFYLPGSKSVAANVPPACHPHPGFVKGEGEGEGEGKGEGEEPADRRQTPSPSILSTLLDAFPYDATRLSKREEDRLQAHEQWLTDNMSSEHWKALGAWMRASERQRGRSLFPKDRGQFLQDPSQCFPVFWSWWEKGAKNNHKAKTKAPEPQPQTVSQEDREELLAILKSS